MSKQKVQLPTQNTNEKIPLKVEVDKSHFINRELSQLLFNARVLEQSLDKRHPLLERLKFLLIFSSNLDEFFEVRVAKLKLQVRYGREVFGPDGLSPKSTLKRLAERCHIYISKQYQVLNDILLPELAKENIHFLKREEWNKSQREWIQSYFDKEVAPIISPIALDPAHPFPKLVNKSLNFIVTLKGKDAFGRESRLAIVPAPRSLPRLIKLPKDDESNKDEFVFLSAVIHEFVDGLFHGMKATGCYQFRVTRNSDLNVKEEEIEDMAAEVQGKLFNRRYGHAVRIEVVENCPEHIVRFLLDEYELTERDLYKCDGPVNLKRLFAVFEMLERPGLEYPEFSPEMPPALESSKCLFDSIKAKDHLLLHPYSSFNPVLDLLRQAALDPAVMSIKQTLYRAGHNSEIVNILVEAARNGKEVTAVIELKARFDEQENLALASRLQEAGAVVCYGVVGYKTHAKMMLILRKESGEFCRYVHLGTGNYHIRNARIYTDYSLFSSNEQLCEDVHKIFQQLTGMGKTLPMKHLFNAPFTLKKKILRLIENETEAAQEGKSARIIIKVNGLTDKSTIVKLYKASQAGVRIDLIIRGICALRPGVKGLSENIAVKSVIGRFLEHNRAFYFENAEHQVYCASADLMERNLSKRIEVCFPILSAKLRERVYKDLTLFITDKGQSWVLDSNGDYRLMTSRTSQKLVQQILLDKHCETAARE
ncbi:polyphosphate kinase 1 [Aliikangiella coralliicola]|uniref:Polyphosphate kinase n=1 Tax=Aliikangiella coralliicola TaxID=2592383 RepID=A0A545UHB7_9GAMM|nr:polyphosphate kinase 1 [Aliikangiella coralliicola]TQV88855.1 polyphosphate kinase 1 [Aliikangiella coralliicola]